MRKSKGKGRPRSVMGRLLPPVDITSPSQLNELDKRIKSGPLTLVLVYADWCGHCQHFKPMMSELEKCKDRSIQTARVRDDMFPKSSISSAKIEGYPSLLLVKENGEVASFKNSEGEVTNAVPDHTNMSKMTSIVRTAGTPSGQNILLAAENVEVNAVPANTADPEMFENSEFTGTAAGLVNTNYTGNATPTNGSIPKNIVADRLSPENVNRLNSTLVGSANNLLKEATAPVVKTAQHGGGLWSSLVMASRNVAPAAVLFLGAEATRKGSKGSKGSKGRHHRATRKVRKSRKGNRK